MQGILVAIRASQVIVLASEPQLGLGDIDRVDGSQSNGIVATQALEIKMLEILKESEGLSVKTAAS